MLRSIFLYELKHWLKKASTYSYFAVFFLVALVTFAGSAGFFDPHSTSYKQQLVMNSPHSINYKMHYFNKLFLFLLPAIIGASVYRDYQHHSHRILYTFPIPKSAYLLGKFFSAFVIIITIALSVGIAVFIGEQLPNLDPQKMGENKDFSNVDCWGF